MASTFDLPASLERAAKRFGAKATARRPRADRGRLRLPAELSKVLKTLLEGDAYPGVEAIRSELQRRCAALGVACPSRATIYKIMREHDGPSYRATDLPPAVRAALYNLDDDARVPARQLAFHCFNYGDLTAVQWGAGMPWLALYQAARMRGWRPYARGLLGAVMAARKMR